MAARKAQLLNKLNRPTRHGVRSCNILEADGPDSIASVLNELDPTKKVIVITEGLVNYFPLPVIREVWSRLAKNLKRFPDAYYLTDLRSEEHTSELQSRPHLVCRLLLEKKKQQ